MAVLNEDDKLNPQGQATGGGGAFIGSGSGQGATTSVHAPTSSGSYTNLENYIGANQGGSDVKMGQAAYGVVDTAGKEANKAISGLHTAASAAGNPEDVTQFSEYQPAQNAVGKVAGTKNSDTGKYSGGLLGSLNGGQNGVGSLLKDAYAQPSYTAGENQLDAFLTGASQGGQQRLGAAQKKWGDIGTKFDNAGKADTPNPYVGPPPTSAPTPINPGFTPPAAGRPAANRNFAVNQSPSAPQATPSGVVDDQSSYQGLMSYLNSMTSTPPAAAAPAKTRKNNLR